MPDVTRRESIALLGGAAAAWPLAARAQQPIPVIGYLSPGSRESDVLRLMHLRKGLSEVELGPKQLELLHDLVPAATTIALLVNPTTPTIAETLTKELRTAALAFGLQLHILHASTKGDFDTAFAALERLRAGALVIATDN